MSPTVDAFLRSWPAAPWLTAALALTAAVYLRGWRTLSHRDPERWPAARPASFIAGLAAIWLALASPIEPFAALLLQVHMAQHLLLMMLAPPLIWLGWPLFPLLRGLPEPVRTYWAAPLFRSHGLRAALTWLTNPPAAWCVYVATTWLWHAPAGYELALGGSGWHFAEHACFIASALLFWYPVVRPYPARPRWSRWLLFPYLILADVQNTILSAWLTFSPQVIYPHYAAVPRIGGLSALEDQAAAGVMMWVPGSIAFLLPLLVIGVQLMRGVAPQRRRLAAASALLTIAGPPRLSTQTAFDLLSVPGLGRCLRWRYARPTLQTVMALFAAVVIFDGLTGPQVSGMNLSGVAPWIHWRGFLVLGLLVAGNVFCLACPFTLPRTLARRWLTGDRPWPRWLSNKWLAVGLTAVFLWSYETFALWDRPAATAWIALAYFAAALAVDGLFRGGSFCKYVCPIGQFNFVQSLVSPLEVKVRDAATCASCRTMECIRGSATISGCETGLFLPRKRGNLDCTFCLDCVHACPHQNVGLLAVVPGATLWHDPIRAGIGRLSRRPDIAALIVVLVFGAAANAAGMVAPVLAWQDRLRAQLGAPPAWLITTAFYLAAVVLLPLALVYLAAALARRWGALTDGRTVVAARYSLALVPLGFAIWLAHYSFHLLTSAGAIVPAAQRFAADRGWPSLGDPLWQYACCRPAAVWLPYLEVLMLDVGLLVSLYCGLRIAESSLPRRGQAWKAFAPWGALLVGLFVVACWIVFQPMEMRGTLPAAG